MIHEKLVVYGMRRLPVPLRGPSPSMSKLKDAAHDAHRLTRRSCQIMWRDFDGGNHGKFMPEVIYREAA